MKTGKPVHELARMLLGLVIVAAITIAIIGTLRVPAPGSATAAVSPNPTSSPQQTATMPQQPTTAVPYPVPWVHPLTLTAIVEETSAETYAAAKATWVFAFEETQRAYTPPPTAPFTYPPTGTLDDPYVRASAKMLAIYGLNGWRGLWDGKVVGVYAGAWAEGSDQGIIDVWFDSGEVGKFLTPTRHGGVRVVSEQDNRLTLVSTDGTTYYFDIPSLSYVSSLTVFAPSITPVPTRTPVPPNYATVTSTPYPPPYYNPYPNPTVP
jgi:hypothetical protein